MIAASRETVTRVLMEFKKRHIVRAKGTTLIVRNKAALAFTGQRNRVHQTALT